MLRYTANRTQGLDQMEKMVVTSTSDLLSNGN